MNEYERKQFVEQEVHVGYRASLEWMTSDNEREESQGWVAALDARCIRLGSDKNNPEIIIPYERIVAYTLTSEPNNVSIKKENLEFIAQSRGIQYRLDPEEE